MAIEQTHLERIAVGQRLQAFREEKGWSLRIAAHLVGSEAETLRRFETGERSPKLEMAIRLAALYGRSLDELIPPGMLDSYRVPDEVVDFLSRRAAQLPQAAPRELRGETSKAVSGSTSSQSRDLNAPARKSSKKKAGEQQRRRSSVVSREGGITTIGPSPATTLEYAPSFERSEWTA